MPKVVREPLQKHTLNFYAGDIEELRLLFPDQDVSSVVRELVRNCITEMRRREREDQAPLTAGIKI